MPPKINVAAGTDTGKLTVLVLQGGGALGAYECGALRYLYEELEDFTPNVIAGVSIGAINAAALAAPRDGDPVGTVERLWDDLSVETAWLPAQLTRYLGLFGNPAFYWPRWDFLPSPIFWTHFYDVTPMVGTLERLVAFDRLDPGHRPRLVVTATDVVTGEPVSFDSGMMRIESKHILASGGLPPGFSWLEIDGKYYWDGGLFNNTPLSPVFEVARREGKEIGTLAVIDLWPERGLLPKNFADVYERIFGIIFRNKMTDDIRQAKTINAYLDTLNALPDEAARKRYDLARILRPNKPSKKFMRVDRFIHVTPDPNRQAEDITGPFDFSKDRIELRKEHGKEDAKRAVGESAPEQEKKEMETQRKSRDLGMTA